MQTILNTMKTGTAKEKLAVISDLVSILGVSLASIFGGLFAIGATSQGSNLRYSEIFFAVIASLISLAGFLLSIAFFILLLLKISKLESPSPIFKKLVIVAIWLVFISLFMIAMTYYYLMITSVVYTK
jgi:hypothetical protein